MPPEKLAIAPAPGEGYDPELAKLKKKTKVSYFDNIILHGVLKADEGGATNTTTTIYTCPSDKIFFLVASTLGFLNDSIAPTSASARLRVAGKFFMNMDTPDVAEAHEYHALNYSIPIKLNAGETIQVIGDDARSTAHATFIGYEIDIKTWNLFSQFN